MASPARPPLHGSAPIPLFAALALVFGLLAASRLDAPDRWNLLLVAAAFLSAGCALSNSVGHAKKQLGAGALSVAAGMLLLQRVLGPPAPELDALVWMLIITAIIFWVDNPLTISRMTLAAAALLALVLPIFVHLADPRLPAAPAQFVATIAACLAFANALARGTPPDTAQVSNTQIAAKRLSRQRSEPRALPARVQMRQLSCVPAEMPSFVLWFLGGVAAAFSAVSTSHAWTPIAVFLLAAALFVEAILPRDIGPFFAVTDPGLGFQIPALAVLLSGAALAVATVVAGSPFGWPLAGIVFVALGSLIVIRRQATLASSLEWARLRIAAQDGRIDPLTGLANRRALDNRLEEEIARATRYGHPLTMLMIDIDDFKQLNDLFGHATGDIVLKSVAGILSDSIRAIDIAARYGGEEFIILLPETTQEGAAIVSERIRSIVEDKLNATVSIGVAELAATDPTSGDLIDRADAAMYRAKHAGKNRVELAR